MNAGHAAACRTVGAAAPSPSAPKCRRAQAAGQGWATTWRCSATGRRQTVTAERRSHATRPEGSAKAASGRRWRQAPLQRAGHTSSARPWDGGLRVCATQSLGPRRSRCITWRMTWARLRCSRTTPFAALLWPLQYSTQAMSEGAMSSRTLVSVDECVREEGGVHGAWAGGRCMGAGGGLEGVQGAGGAGGWRALGGRSGTRPRAAGAKLLAGHACGPYILWYTPFGGPHGEPTGMPLVSGREMRFAQIQPSTSVLLDKIRSWHI